jgi:hypothetical protein
MLCGDMLGEGATRVVFEYEPDRNLVIKFETGISTAYQNVAEHLTWQAVKETPWARWFAPVVKISPCGNVLLMHRTTPILRRDQLPRRLPSFFADVKSENFGRLLDGPVVAHDYGHVGLLVAGLATTRLVKAAW